VRSLDNPGRARQRLGRRAFLGGAATVAAGGLGPALAACATPASPAAGGGKKGGRKALTVAIVGDPETLDPGGVGNVYGEELFFAIFDPLMWKFPGDRTLHPGLAQRFTVSEDLKTYTFHLRTDVKFHDGTPLTADAVKASFDHIYEPSTRSETAQGLLGPYKETRVLDAHTAQVVFSKPNAAFLDEVGNSPLSISSPTALKKYGSNYGFHPVGTGPFIFKSYVSNNQVVVERNPDYTWGPTPLGAGPAKLDQITFHILADAPSQYNALQSGQLLIADALTPQDVTSAVQGGKKKLTSLSTGTPNSITVNCTKDPTNDLRVRQALEYAADQEAIVKTLYEGLYQPAFSVLTPTTPGYSASQHIYPHNPAKAGQLLDAAGWTRSGNGIRTKNGQKLTLDFINFANAGFGPIAELLQSQWSAVGIQTLISQQPFPGLATTYNDGKQHLGDWFYVDFSPYELNVGYNSSQIKSGYNWAHYDNPKLDAAFDAVNAEPSEVKRTQMYEQIAMTIMQAAVNIPVYNIETVLVTAPNVSGIQFTPSALPLFHAADM
jgi:peptide/nickel transport system substrate-binding protein